MAHLFSIEYCGEIDLSKFIHVWRVGSGQIFRDYNGEKTVEFAKRHSFACLQCSTVLSALYAYGVPVCARVCRTIGCGREAGKCGRSSILCTICLQCDIEGLQQRTAWTACPVHKCTQIGHSQTRCPVAAVYHEMCCSFRRQKRTLVPTTAM